MKQGRLRGGGRKQTGGAREAICRLSRFLEGGDRLHEALRRRLARYPGREPPETSAALAGGNKVRARRQVGLETEPLLAVARLMVELRHGSNEHVHCLGRAVAVVEGDQSWTRRPRGLPSHRSPRVPLPGARRPRGASRPARPLPAHEGRSRAARSPAARPRPAELRDRLLGSSLCACRAGRGPQALDGPRVGAAAAACQQVRDDLALGRAELGESASGARVRALPLGERQIGLQCGLHEGVTEAKPLGRLDEVDRRGSTAAPAAASASRPATAPTTGSVSSPSTTRARARACAAGDNRSRRARIASPTRSGTSRPAARPRRRAVARPSVPDRAPARSGGTGCRRCSPGRPRRTQCPEARRAQRPGV